MCTPVKASLTDLVQEYEVRSKNVVYETKKGKLIPIRDIRTKDLVKIINDLLKLQDEDWYNSNPVGYVTNNGKRL